MSSKIMLTVVSVSALFIVFVSSYIIFTSIAESPYSTPTPNTVGLIEVRNLCVEACEGPVVSFGGELVLVDGVLLSDMRASGHWMCECASPVE